MTAKEVKAAIAAKDSAVALTAALAWWRATRDAAVADLVDAISDAVSQRGPIDDEAAWSKLAGAKDPLTLGPLLAGVLDLSASFLPRAAELLAAFPDDPRLARAIATWALDPPTSSSSTYPFWTRSLAILARSGDTRCVPILAKRLKMAKKPSQFWPKFYAGLAKAKDAIAAAEPPAGAEAVDATAVGKLAAAAAKLPKLDGAPGGGKVTAVAVAAAAARAAEGSLLAQAQQHLAAGKLVPAIDAMVAAWRACRAPDLADAIDRASRLLPSHGVPIAAPAKKSLEPWLALRQADPSAAMPQLLAALVAGGPAFAERRLLELGSLDDDPRISGRLVEASGWYGISPERTQYWKALFELLSRHADVRTRTPLRVHFYDFTRSYYNHHRQAKRLVGAFALSDTAPPALPPDEAKRLAKLVTAIDAALAADRTEHDLVAAIVAEPDDDAPRLVYADWLQQHAHPRGELLALESKPSPTAAEAKRVKQLLDIHGLFGSLDELGEVTRERGLPRAIAVDSWATEPTWRAIVHHPLLPLVRTIQFGDYRHYTIDEATLPAAVRSLLRSKAPEPD